MHVVRFTLDGGSETPRQSAAELVHDALWAHLGPGQGVEHLTVTAVPDGFDLVLFLRQDLPDSDPVRYARILLEAVVPRVPALRIRGTRDPANERMTDP
jgi:hypothetical protein